MNDNKDELKDPINIDNLIVYQGYFMDRRQNDWIIPVLVIGGDLFEAKDELKKILD